MGDATERQRSTMRSADGVSTSDTRSNTNPALLPANFTRHAPNATVYDRQLIDGRWTDWTNSREEAGELTDGPGFCGSPTNELSGLRRVGTESVDGVITTKYTAKVEYDGDPTSTGPLDLRLDWWVDSSGRLKRRSQTHLAYNTQVVTTYSAFGRVNDISIPGTQATPTPLATATQTPTATTANPCTRVTEHYDVEGRTYAGNDLVRRYLAEVSPVAVLTTFQDNNGRAQAQRLWVGDTWDAVRSESRSVVLSRFTSSGIDYDRAKTSDGSWGPWDSERKSLEGESGASGFCGYSNDHITNVD